MQNTSYQKLSKLLLLFSLVAANAPTALNAVNFTNPFKAIRKKFSKAPAAPAPAANPMIPAPVAVLAAANVPAPAAAIRIAPANDFFNPAIRPFISPDGRNNIIDLLQQGATTMHNANQAIANIQPAIDAKIGPTLANLNNVLTAAHQRLEETRPVTAHLQTWLPLITAIIVPTLLLGGFLMFQKAFKPKNKISLEERIKSILAPKAKPTPKPEPAAENA